LRIESSATNGPAGGTYITFDSGTVNSGGTLEMIDIDMMNPNPLSYIGISSACCSALYVMYVIYRYWVRSTE
jgi:hypothetical protein